MKLLNNKKGMSLMEVLVVVLLIAGLAAMAYPSYLSSIEKTKSSEAVSIVGHTVAAVKKYLDDTGAESSSGSDVNFRNLDFKLTGKDVTISGNTATTPNFTYTIGCGGGSYVCGKRKKGSSNYEYTIKAKIAGDDGEFIICEPTAGNSYDVKVCSSIAKKVGEQYVIQ